MPLTIFLIFNDNYNLMDISNYNRPNSLVSLWVLNMMGAFPFGIAPIFLGIITESMKINEAQIGILAFAEMFGVVFVRLIAPLFIRKIDWRLLSIISASVMVIGYLLTIFADRFELLFLIRMIAGVFGHGIAFVLSATALCDTKNPEKAISIGVIFQLCVTTLMMFILPIVVTNYSKETMFALISLFFLILLPVMLVFPNRGLDTKSETLNTVGIKRILLLSILSLVIYQIGLASIWSFIERMADNAGVSIIQTGKILAMVMPLSITGSILSAAISTKYGRVFPLLFAISGVLLGLSILGDITSESNLFLGFLIHQVSWNFGLPYFYGLVKEFDRNGTLVTLAPGAQAFGAAIGPLITGFAVQNNGFSIVNFVSGAAVFLGASMAILLIKKNQIDN